MKKFIFALCASAVIVSCTPEPTDVPANGPGGVTFTDTDTNLTFGGPVTITRASNESDITAYRIKWGGVGSCIPIGNVIGQVDTSGQGDIVFQMPSGTTKPIAADKILVFSANGAGENLACASAIVVNDDSNAQPPSNPPVSVSFTDIDEEETIGGTVEITRAPIELDVTDYVLRFGFGGCNVQNGFIVELDKTGSDLVYEIPVGTAIPSGATQILAYTKNEVSEMPDCENASTTIENIVDTTEIVTIEHLSGYCLEANGGDLITAVCNGSANQRWELVDEAGNGSDFQVLNEGRGSCIEADFGADDFFAEPCSSSEFQVMTFGDPTPRPGGGSYYEIRNVSSVGTQCMRSDDSPNDPTEQVEADNCSDDEKINWVVFDENSQVISFPFNP